MKFKEIVKLLLKKFYNFLKMQVSSLYLLVKQIMIL